MAIENSGAPTDGGGGNVITDRQLFDHATSDPAPAASPSPAPSPSPSPQPGGQQGGQAPPAQARQPQPQPGQPVRDEQGRFAPRQGQQPGQQGSQTEDHRVPLRDLLEEREKRQRAEFEHQQLMRSIQERQQPQRPPGPETIFDGPDDYLNHRVMNPLRNEGYAMMMQVKDGLSREFANTQHGEQVVTRALADLVKIKDTPDGQHAYRTIMQSGHPYGALVQWHKRAIAHQAIGNDPQAWLRQQQEAWLNDPRVQAIVLQRARAAAGGGQQQPQGQQHGNGQQRPNVSLPPSLSSVPGASSRDAPGDLSSASLYDFATRR